MKKTKAKRVPLVSVFRYQSEVTGWTTCQILLMDTWVITTADSPVLVNQMARSIRDQVTRAVHNADAVRGVRAIRKFQSHRIGGAK